MVSFTSSPTTGCEEHNPNNIDLDLNKNETPRGRLLEYQASNLIPAMSAATQIASGLPKSSQCNISDECSSIDKQSQIHSTIAFSKHGMIAPGVLFRRLPLEVTRMIFRDLLHSIEGVPNILVALAADKEEDGSKSALYLDTKAEYRRLNGKITPKNHNIWKYKRSREFLQIRHLQIVLPVEIRGGLITVKNNFQTVTLYLSPENISGKKNYFIDTMSTLFRASTYTRTLVIKVKKIFEISEVSEVSQVEKSRQPCPEALEKPHEAYQEPTNTIKSPKAPADLREPAIPKKAGLKRSTSPLRASLCLTNDFLAKMTVAVQDNYCTRRALQQLPRPKYDSPEEKIPLETVFLMISSWLGLYPKVREVHSENMQYWRWEKRDGTKLGGPIDYVNLRHSWR